MTVGGTELPSKIVEVVPNAKRLVSGYRDIGYTLNGAMADLVDNSIAAGATEVHIHMAWDGPDSHVVIADNGSGMSSSELEEALRLGSEANYEDEDLGKFGLGLKTASISQCRVLQVGSRTDLDSKADVLRFDLDHIETSNRWEVLREEPSSLPQVAYEWLEKTVGTVVVWSDLDRLLGGHATSSRVQKAFFENVASLELHLGMVFHRFLESDPRVRKQLSAPLTIYLNEKRVAAWDPYARGHADTQELDAMEVPIASKQWAGLVEIQAYVLPAREQFGPGEHEKLAGPNKWNNQQGFYIYRANRLIQSGGWCGLMSPNEHYKLARISIDFGPSLDSAFGINIAKMRVTLPVELREAIRSDVRAIVKIANSTYSAKERKTKQDNNKVAIPTNIPPVRPAWAPPIAQATTKRDIPQSNLPSESSSNSDEETLSPWPEMSLTKTERQRRRKALEQVAEETDTAAALGKLIERLIIVDRKTANDLGW